MRDHQSHAPAQRQGRELCVDLNSGIGIHRNLDVRKFKEGLQIQDTAVEARIAAVAQAHCFHRCNLATVHIRGKVREHAAGKLDLPAD